MDDLVVEARYNTRVGRDEMLTDLLKSYDAVYLAAGCYISNPMTGPDNKIIPGVNLKGVEDGIKLLAKTNFGELVYIGKRVIVLGGGFTAMILSRTSLLFCPETLYVMFCLSYE